MKYPLLMVTNEDKIKFCARAFEVLRLEHNEKGKDAREGRMSMGDFRKYQRGEFRERSNYIFQEMNRVSELEGIPKIDPEKDPDNPKRQWAKVGREEKKWDNIKVKEL